MQSQWDTKVLELYVVQEGKSLSGCSACKNMKMITFHNMNQVGTTESEWPESVTAAKSDTLEGLTKKQIFYQYADCVIGTDCIAEPYHIKIDPETVPVAHPPGKISVTLRDRVKEELENVEQQGIIKKVTEPTSWVTSVVVNEKKSCKLIICVHSKYLNKYVKREYCQYPAQEDITCMLNGVLQQIRCLPGVWQILLDTESSCLTTFNTCHGRYCFTVIPFGFNFAQEVFHRTVNDKFADISGCLTDIDDILAAGKTLAEHDANSKKVLDRVREINMTLIKEKCQFRLTQIDYLGETLTQEGVKPDNEKFKVILEYGDPLLKSQEPLRGSPMKLCTVIVPLKVYQNT